MLCCVKLPNWGLPPVSGLSVASTTVSADAPHLLAADTSSCSSVRPVAHFCPMAVNSEATCRLRALAMYSCTMPRMGTVKRERPSGCLPLGGTRARPGAARGARGPEGLGRRPRLGSQGLRVRAVERGHDGLAHARGACHLAHRVGPRPLGPERGVLALKRGQALLDGLAALELRPEGVQLLAVGLHGRLVLSGLGLPELKRLGRLGLGPRFGGLRLLLAVRRLFVCHRVLQSARRCGARPGSPPPLRARPVYEEGPLRGPRFDWLAPRRRVERRYPVLETGALSRCASAVWSPCGPHR